MARESPPRKARGALQRIRGRRGQGIVELVFALPVFMTLLFGIYEFSRYYSARLRIRSAVAEGTRFAATGNKLLDDDTGTFLSRAESIKTTILSQVGHYGISGADIHILPADGGAPEEVVTVTLDYEYPVAIPLMQSIFEAPILDFSVSTSMRNEPFFD